jgi:hypothetical protein
LFQEIRRRRTEVTVEIRKHKREDTVQKRRNVPTLVDSTGTQWPFVTRIEKKLNSVT